MKDFVQVSSYDLNEIWFCEHESVFTVGRQGKEEHLLNTGSIPVVHTDRGGEVTFHGPEQIVCYPLIHIKEYGLLPKQYLYCLEQAVIDTLKNFSIEAVRVSGAPGVYVSGKNYLGPLSGAQKICSIGIKISNHCTYHGLSLNFAVDLSNFLKINPCGYKGLKVVNIKTLNPAARKEEVIQLLEKKLLEKLCEKRH